MPICNLSILLEKYLQTECVCFIYKTLFARAKAKFITEGGFSPIRPVPHISVSFGWKQVHFIWRSNSRLFIFAVIGRLGSLFVLSPNQIAPRTIILIFYL